jgi:hypothetical protein
MKSRLPYSQVHIADTYSGLLGLQDLTWSQGQVLGDSSLYAAAQ